MGHPIRPAIGLPIGPRIGAPIGLPIVRGRCCYSPPPPPGTPSAAKALAKCDGTRDVRRIPTPSWGANPRREDSMSCASPLHYHRLHCMYAQLAVSNENAHGCRTLRGHAPPFLGPSTAATWATGHCILGPGPSRSRINVTYGSRAPSKDLCLCTSSSPSKTKDASDINHDEDSGRGVSSRSPLPSSSSPYFRMGFNPRPFMKWG